MGWLGGELKDKKQNKTKKYIMFLYWLDDFFVSEEGK